MDAFGAAQTGSEIWIPRVAQANLRRGLQPLFIFEITR